MTHLVQVEVEAAAHALLHDSLRRHRLLRDSAALEQPVAEQVLALNERERGDLQHVVVAQDVLVHLHIFLWPPVGRSDEKTRLAREGSPAKRGMGQGPSKELVYCDLQPVSVQPRCDQRGFPTRDSRKTSHIPAIGSSKFGTGHGNH